MQATREDLAQTMLDRATTLLREANEAIGKGMTPEQVTAYATLSQANLVAADFLMTYPLTPQPVQEPRRW